MLQRQQASSHSRRSSRAIIDAGRCRLLRHYLALPWHDHTAACCCRRQHEVHCRWTSVECCCLQVQLNAEVGQAMDKQQFPSSFIEWEYDGTVYARCNFQQQYEYSTSRYLSVTGTILRARAVEHHLALYAVISPLACRIFWWTRLHCTLHSAAAPACCWPSLLSLFRHRQRYVCGREM